MEQGSGSSDTSQRVIEPPDRQLGGPHELTVVTKLSDTHSSAMDLVGQSNDGSEAHDAEATASGNSAQQTTPAQVPTSHASAPQSSAPNYIDPMGRPYHIATLDNREWYIKPYNAKLVELSVQSGTDHQYDGANWNWVPVEDKTPLVIKLNMFVWKSMPGMIGTLRKEDDEIADPTATATEPRQHEPTEQHRPSDLFKLRFPRNPKLQLCTRWAFATIVILPLLFDPRTMEGRIDNNGYYDPVRYRDWGYTRSARNPQENDGNEGENEDGNENEHRTRPQFDLPNDASLEEKPEDILGSSKEVKKYKDGHFNLQQEKAARGDHYDDRFYDLPSRHLRPRLLCFRSDYIPDPRRPGQELKDIAADPTSDGPSDAGPPAAGPSTAGPSNAEQPGCRVQSPDGWISEYGQDASTEYVFVSYSRQQFIVDDDESIEKWWKVYREERYSTAELEDFKRQARTDRKHLIDHGIQAARAAGVPAFWIDFLCLPPKQQLGYKLLGISEEDKNEDKDKWIEDVYRICDVSRAAHSMIIVLGPPNIQRAGTEPEHIPLGNLSFSTGDDEMKTRWLRQWGKRLWTLPELLLCPTEHRIAIYYVDSNAPKPEKLETPLRGQPEKLAKRNFAIRAYEDGQVVRELVDHYEGSLILTTLELVTKAFECLWRRDTNLSRPGDQSYALMGLLRRRPDVNYNDSAFEAFARLSLANDSNLLLERLLCMLPKKRGQQWHVMVDAWDVNLWDIEPICQVAGIVDNRTVLLDGAFGATIQWHALKPVGYVKRKNFWREAGKVGLRLTPGWFIIGVTTVASLPKGSNYVDPGVVFGALFLAVTLILILTSPYLFLHLYKGKFWGTQACFFGIEGPIELSAIEKALFGFDHGRLKWSTNGSLLSRHRLNKRTKKCVPLPPNDTGPGNEHGRLFTLVDTYTMTATRFRAVRPPVAVLICGREGGMQRAILCSYDWRTNTFCRETVLRMKTIILERMFRVDRFRFALSRDALPEGPDAQVCEDNDHLRVVAARDERDRKRVDRLDRARGVVGQTISAAVGI